MSGLEERGHTSVSRDYTPGLFEVLSEFWIHRFFNDQGMVLAASEAAQVRRLALAADPRAASLPAGELAGLLGRIRDGGKLGRPLERSEDEERRVNPDQIFIDTEGGPAREREEGAGAEPAAEDQSEPDGVGDEELLDRVVEAADAAFHGDGAIRFFLVNAGPSYANGGYPLAHAIEAEIESAVQPDETDEGNFDNVLNALDNMCSEIGRVGRSLRARREELLAGCRRAA